MMWLTFQLSAFWLILVAETAHVDNVSAHKTHTNEGHISRGKRLMMKPAHLWPNGIAPYAFEESALPYKHEIERVIAFIEDQSCVRFPEWNKATSAKYKIHNQAHISFHVHGGCVSGVGYFGGVVRTSCCSGEACLHEISHALGFAHEQNAPDRKGWIDVNMDVVPSNRKSWYTETHSGYYNYSRPYDISTMMHYHPVQFTKGKPAFVMDFPELSVAGQYFYHFKEMAEGYKCDAKPQCQGRDLGCTNDGYQTVQHGKCRCVCPLGLDPDNACRTILKKVTTASWPKGQYALPSPKTGCPTNGSFHAGEITEDGFATGNHMSANYQMLGTVKGIKMNLHFCTRTAKDDVFPGDQEAGSKFNWPMGTYCVYQAGDSCPTGFDLRSIQYSAKHHISKGTVPAASLGHIPLCCQYRGFTKEPAAFPNDRPFALVGYPGKNCQEVTVQGWPPSIPLDTTKTANAKCMRHTIEHFTFTSNEMIDADNAFFSRWFTGHHKRMTVPICHYKPVDMNCGSVIALSKENPLKMIQSSVSGTKDRECTWVIKSESDKGTFVLDFTSFNMIKPGGICKNKMEVRHAMIGQDGLEYCDPVKNSIRSITNKMMIKFSTTGYSSSSFTARVKWIPFDDMCYDVADRGVSYDGDINYTRTFQPCLPWAEKTECPHHPFNNERSDLVHNLKGNLCRNPDNSFRPWCYTDKEGCARNYCDVCGLEKPFDNTTDCNALKKQGFCTRDPARAILNCAATCSDQLPDNYLKKKYTDISCGRPTPPSNRMLQGPKLKSIYKVGETVQYSCRTGYDVVSSRCMTSGQWSKFEMDCNECPYGSVIYKDKCYIHLGHGFLNYNNAVAVSKKAGGTLAVPRNVEESELLVNMLDKKHGQWIGINDKKIEGHWVYENGSDIGWTHWYTDVGEPNSNGNQDCVMMRASTFWIDLECCNTHYYFITAFPRIDFEKPQCADSFGDKCTALLTDRPTLCIDFPDFARQYCSQSCGIKIPGCNVKDVTCPVGHDKGSNPKPLSTSASSVTLGKVVTYGCDRFSYKVGGDETRVCMQDGTMSGEPLQCADCPFGYQEVGNECHGLLVEKMLTYPEAVKACDEVGGFLALAKNQDENDVIGTVGLGVNVWLGLTDEAKENHFVWQDGASVLWTAWAEGNPLPKGDRADIVYMNSLKQWVNIDRGWKVKMRTVCTISKLDDDTCYDSTDGGVSYDGPVNYTRAYQPCLPWSQATKCPHNSFQKDEELDNLVGNSCRNPDNSYRPWCYTELDGCIRNYCDVCGNDTPKDDSDCQDFEARGLCQKDPVRAAQKCPVRCLGILPDGQQAAPYTDIHCGPPTPPSDGTVVGPVKARYALGETVEYKCNKAAWSVFARCMTSGQWSQTGYACPDCPVGFTAREDRCYRLFTEVQNYTNAVAQCESLGSFLAVPRNRKEHIWMKRTAHSYYTWVGLSDLKTEGEWVDENGIKPQWTFWLKGEPNGKRDENCVKLGRLYGWIDISCSRHYKFFCETVKMDNKICKDFLPDDQCSQLLKENLTTCHDHPDYARVHCVKTCGMCP